MAARSEPPSASLGGSRGYDPEHRRDALTANAHNVKLTPSDASLSRWGANGVSRKRQRGNHGAVNVRGQHTLLLVVCRELYPKATADEVRTFIAAHATNPVLYTAQDIIRREDELGYSRKKGSTTANQANTPLNRLRRQMFWTTAHPTGVIGTPRQRLIDIDEAGLWIEKANRKFGKSLVRQSRMHTRARTHAHARTHARTLARTRARTHTHTPHTHTHTHTHTSLACECVSLGRTVTQRSGPSSSPSIARARNGW
jgi:hypothetical protein